MENSYIRLLKRSERFIALKDDCMQQAKGYGVIRMLRSGEIGNGEDGELRFPAPQAADSRLDARGAVCQGHR